MFVVLCVAAMGCRGPDKVEAKDYGVLVSVRVTQPEIEDLGGDIRRMEKIVSEAKKEWPEGAPKVSLEVRIISTNSEGSKEIPMLSSQGQRRLLTGKESAGLLRAVKASEHAQVMQAPAMTLRSEEAQVLKITTDGEYVKDSQFSMEEVGTESKGLRLTKRKLTSGVAALAQPKIEVDIVDFERLEVHLSTVGFVEREMWAKHAGGNVCIARWDQPTVIRWSAKPLESGPLRLEFGTACLLGPITVVTNYSLNGADVEMVAKDRMSDRREEDFWGWREHREKQALFILVRVDRPE